MGRLLLVLEGESAKPVQGLKQSDKAMALTLGAATRLAKGGIEPLWVTDLVEHTRACELSLTAQNVAERFAAQACGGGAHVPAERLDNVDWGRILLEDNEIAFFREMVIGAELARAVLRAGFNEVVWSDRSDYPPYMPQFALLETMASILGPRLSFAKRRPGLREHAMRHLRQNGLWELVRRRQAPRGQRKLVSDRGESHCEVVAIFSRNHWERYSEPLGRMRQQYGKDIEVWNLGSAPSGLREWGLRTDTRIEEVPYPQRVANGISEFFSARLAWWIDAGLQDVARETGCREIENTALVPHWQSIFSYTLAHAAQWGRMLQDKLKITAPHWVVGSAAFTYLTELPYLIARELGIATVALSHTYVSRDYGFIGSGWLACRNRFERLNFRRAFPIDDRVMFCYDASNSLSYSATEKGTPPANANVVTILTAAPIDDERAMSTVDSRKFWEGLNELGRVPEDLGELDLVLKSHPRFDISRMVQARNEAIRVSPANASVRELLEQSWVVVLWNHFGGVVVEAIQTGKPVVFVDTAGYCQPYLEFHAFEAGVVVHRTEELWSVLRDILRSQTSYRRLQKRCQHFRAEYLEPTTRTVTDELGCRW